MRAAAAETAAAHEGDDNTPSGPTGRGVKTSVLLAYIQICRPATLTARGSTLNVRKSIPAL